MVTYNETMSGGALGGGNALLNLIIDKSFAWDTGEQPLFWWRLQGVCTSLMPSSGGCDVVGLQIGEKLTLHTAPTSPTSQLLTAPTSFLTFPSGTTSCDEVSPPAGREAWYTYTGFMQNSLKVVNVVYIVSGGNPPPGYNPYLGSETGLCFHIVGNIATSFGSSSSSSVSNEQNCSTSQQFIQNVLARNLSEVCDQLQKSGLKWSLASVKKFSRPANNNDPNECNILKEVPFSDVPDCMKFSLSDDVFVNAGVTVEVFIISITDTENNNPNLQQSIYSYVGSGEIVFGGNAETYLNYESAVQPTTSVYSYGPSGPQIVFGGQAQTDTSWQTLYVVNIGASVVVEREEAIFNVSASDPLEIPYQFVATNCGLCVDVPTLLYVHHNLASSGMLSDFLQRNGFELPTPLIFHYSNRLQSWVGNYHLLGEDNESWRFVFEWACTSDDFGSVWKFSILAIKKNINTGMDFDTRIVITFNSGEICSGTQNLGFDFSFNMNTKTEYVYNNFNVMASDVIIHDNIGLFKSNNWNKNPNLNIRISKNEIATTSERKDIYPIFPRQVSILS